MTYELTKKYKPARYTLGEGFILQQKNNTLTERQAAPYVEAGILKETRPKATPKRAKDGES